MKMNTTIKALGIAVVAAVAGLLTWTLALQPGQPLKPPAGLETTILPRAKTLDPFQLVDSEGHPFGVERLKGKWSLLFFGYTHCPDICPTTLMTLRGVRNALESTPDYLRDVQFLFVSVDPKRDTLEHLRQYVRFFHPDFLGATGEKAQIDQLVAQTGAVYMFDGDTESDNYIVNHSATILLVDPQGRLYARFGTPHTVEGVSESFRRVRDFHG